MPDAIALAPDPDPTTRHGHRLAESMRELALADRGLTALRAGLVGDWASWPAKDYARWKAAASRRMRALEAMTALALELFPEDA